MATIRKVRADLMNQSRQTDRVPTAAQLARQKRESQFRELVMGLSTPDDVFLVSPSEGEKASTIRSGLRKVARELGRERDVIVRKHQGGFLVALSTPEREARRRGRRATAS